MFALNRGIAEDLFACDVAQQHLIAHDRVWQSFITAACVG